MTWSIIARNERTERVGIIAAGSSPLARTSGRALCRLPRQGLHLAGRRNYVEADIHSWVIAISRGFVGRCGALRVRRWPHRLGWGGGSSCRQR
jgi:hypothetical protein